MFIVYCLESNYHYMSTIGDPIFTLKTPIISFKTPRFSLETLRFSFGTPNMGDSTKIQRKYGVSNDNLGVSNGTSLGVSNKRRSPIVL